MDKNSLSLEDCMHLHSIYYSHTHPKCCNFANIFGFCFNILSQKDLLDYICQVPHEYKRNGRISLELINNLYPKLLDIPFFTHSHHKQFDKERMLLNDIPDYSISHMVKQSLKKVLGTRGKMFLKNLTSRKGLKYADCMLRK